jgi:predicted KAP-like P-loop ATPase
MWADTDTRLDFLNYSEVAELTIDLVKDRRMLPVSIGVFGTWGTGKSTLLNLIEQGLNPEGVEQAFIVVRFDAWLYQGYDDARAALMEVIATTLLEAAEKNKGLAEKARRLLGRVNKMRLLGLAAEAGAYAMGVPTFGILTKGIGALGDFFFDDNGDEKGFDALRKAGNDVRERSKSLIEEDKKGTPPREIAAFRSEFGEVLAGLGKSLAVFVDNLDRCMPKQTIHTLEALRLFLFLPNTAFVIAADEEMVRSSVETHFKDIDARHVTDYLDKIIQVPIRVPRIGVQEVRAYMFLLFAEASGVAQECLEALRKGLETNLQQAWKVDPISREDALKLCGGDSRDELILGFEIADRIAPLLASSTLVQGNPRIVKRMLNVVRMRSRLAKRRSMALDEALIAKLALFERCTDGSVTVELYKAIQEAANGKPEILKKLEKLADEPDEFKDACPESWRQKHHDFIRQWMTLDPKLANVDLRPALYLSRETVPLRALHGGLSRSAAEALRLLLLAKNTSMPSARSAVSAMDASEHGVVMEAVVTELSKHTDWTKSPPGFNGARILAELAPDTGKILARFIRKITGDELKPWMKPILKDAPWWSKSGDSR